MLEGQYTAGINFRAEEAIHALRRLEHYMATRHGDCTINILEFTCGPCYDYELGHLLSFNVLYETAPAR